MSTLDKLRNQAVQRGMKLMSDPRFMKLMSSPQAQKLMMMAFQLPGKIEGAFAKQGKRFACQAGFTACAIMAACCSSISAITMASHNA